MPAVDARPPACTRRSGWARSSLRLTAPSGSTGRNLDGSGGRSTRSVSAPNRGSSQSPAAEPSIPQRVGLGRMPLARVIGRDEGLSQLLGGGGVDVAANGPATVAASRSMTSQSDPARRIAATR